MRISYNYVINIILIISFYVIISLKLHILPLCEINLPADTINNLNEVSLNLSYGYITGFIMYLFTVIIPTNSRNRIIKSLIKDNIEAFYRITLYNYFIFCNQLHDDDYSLKEFCQNYSEIVKSIPKRLKSTNRIKALINITDAKKDFIRNMTIYNDSLTLKQLKIFAAIQNDNFDRVILSFKDEKVEGEDNEMEIWQYLYAVSNPMAKLITDIHNTIKRNK